MLSLLGTEVSRSQFMGVAMLCFWNQCQRPKWCRALSPTDSDSSKHMDLELYHMKTCQDVLIDKISFCWCWLTSAQSKVQWNSLRLTLNLFLQKQSQKDPVQCFYFLFFSTQSSVWLDPGVFSIYSECWLRRSMCLWLRDSGAFQLPGTSLRKAQTGWGNHLLGSSERAWWSLQRPHWSHPVGQSGSSVLQILPQWPTLRVYLQKKSALIMRTDMWS